MVIGLHHHIDGAMDARWSENAKYCFYRKVHNFQIVLIVSRTSHMLNAGFQPNIERLKMYSSSLFHVSDLLNEREMDLNF